MDGTPNSRSNEVPDRRQRVEQLMADEGLSWQEAWRRTEDQAVPSESGEGVQWGWVAAGVVAALVSSGGAQIALQRGDEPIELGSAAFFVFLALPLLSFLVIVGVGVWFGSTGPSSSWHRSSWPSLSLIGGIGGGLAIFLIVFSAITGEGRDEVGLAVAVVIPGIYLIGIPLWIIGLLVGGGLRLVWTIGRRDNLIKQPNELTSPGFDQNTHDEVADHDAGVEHLTVADRIYEDRVRPRPPAETVPPSPAPKPPQMPPPITDTGNSRVPLIVGIVTLALVGIFWLMLSVGIVLDPSEAGAALFGGIILTALPIALGIYLVRRGRR